MDDRLSKINLLNHSLTKLFLSSLLIGLPILTAIEAKADTHQNMPHSDLEMPQENDTVEPESEAYDSIDGGYDGEPVVTIPETIENETNAAINHRAIGFTKNQTLEGGESHVLRGLPVPVVIRAARQDDGFVTTEPIVNEEGMLESLSMKLPSGI